LRTIFHGAPASPQRRMALPCSRLRRVSPLQLVVLAANRSIPILDRDNIQEIPIAERDIILRSEMPFATRLR
jgi:hypothetical protein